MSRIHGKEQPIGQIFSKEYAFSIPPYQRPYSWGKEQVSELCSDLLSSFRATTSGEPYFLGSIVLIKDESNPEAEVIDGQQRLTTLSLLIAVILKTLPADRVKSGFKALLYEEGDPIMGTKDRFRLKIRDRDNDFFEQHILKSDDLSQLSDLDPKNLSDPRRRLRDNALYILNALEGLSIEELEKFAAYVIQNTFLIVVWTPNLNSAFRIFSVLNDRGLDLSAADILKAEIIGLIAEPEREDYTDKWESIEENLGTDSFADLFSHIRFLSARKKQRKSVLEEFREYVDAKTAPKKFIDEKLVPYSEALEQIIHQSYESSSDADTVNRYLGYLSRMDESDWIAPAILYHAKNSNFSSKLKQFYIDLERLVAAIWIMRLDINQRIDRYSQLIKAIEDGGDLFAAGSPLQLTDDEIEATIKELDGDIYNISRKSKRTMILLRLDAALSSGEAQYHFKTITIEHVLPQTPPENSEWTQWWPDEDERSVNVHRLGNLVLLNRRQNSAAKNYDFQKKKDAYFMGKAKSSPFALTTGVMHHSEWTPKIFEERQKTLLSKLKDEWRLKA